MVEFRDDRRAGGRDQLERNVRLANRDPLQDLQSGRSRQRIFSMRRAESAVTVNETRKIDAQDLECFESDAAQNDIDDGVECPDLMKLHLFDGCSMNL